MMMMMTMMIVIMMLRTLHDMTILDSNGLIIKISMAILVISMVMLMTYFLELPFIMLRMKTKIRLSNTVDVRMRMIL